MTAELPPGSAVSVTPDESAVATGTVEGPDAPPLYDMNTLAPVACIVLGTKGSMTVPSPDVDPAFVKRSRTNGFAP